MARQTHLRFGGTVYYLKPYNTGAAIHAGIRLRRILGPALPVFLENARAAPEQPPESASPADEVFFLCFGLSEKRDGDLVALARGALRHCLPVNPDQPRDEGTMPRQSIAALPKKDALLLGVRALRELLREFFLEAERFSAQMVLAEEVFSEAMRANAPRQVPVPEGYEGTAFMAAICHSDLASYPDLIELGLREFFDVALAAFMTLLGKPEQNSLGHMFLY